MHNRTGGNSGHSRDKVVTIAPVAALIRYACAERALCENAIAEYAAGIMHETPEYLAANRESCEADLAVPRWLGWLKVIIGWRITCELDYYRLTGQS